MEKFQKFSSKKIFVYGKVSHEKIFLELSKADFLLMPSRFLETFWLVALESLSAWVPVIGFRKGWLLQFIPASLALDESQPVESFLKIIEKNLYDTVDISHFLLENWRKNLIELTKNFSKILLVHDYEEEIGGAEVYVQNLKKELQQIGKEVEFFGFQWKISPKVRRKLFFSSLFGKKQEKELSQKIAQFQPDLIWSHTILRYIGVGGMKAIKKSNIPHYIMHHDLWLFVSRPSRIFSLQDIPKNQNLGSWIFPEKKFSGQIIATIKWIIIKRIFSKIPHQTIHIVPSEFMIPIVKNADSEQVKLFSHTIFK